MGWLDRLRQSLRRRPATIPATLWTSVLAQLPFLDYLQPPERAQLKALTETFLDRTPMIGRDGMDISDEVAVLIAAQASVLVLHLHLRLYDDLSAVVVHPRAFMVRQQQMDDAGVVHEWSEPLAGEALDQGGAVVLSWEDITSGPSPAPAHNIVIHEFAHKIDMGRGAANGYPPFLPGLHEPTLLAPWPDVFSAAYEDFCNRVDQLEQDLPADFDEDIPWHAAHYDRLAEALPLDPYASRDPAEFFAVASESFFVRPAPLAAAYPAVFSLLRAYYRQDPLARR